MIKGIYDYLKDKQNLRNAPKVLMSDIKIRDGVWEQIPLKYENLSLKEYIREEDFLSDDYSYNKVDYVIMNPPFTTIEPFVIRGLEIAEKGLLVFGRLQFLEGQSRYENILKDNPPTDIYVYVDRIKCGKNGDFANTEAI